MSKTKIEVFAEKIAGSEKNEHGGRVSANYAIGEVSYSKGGISYFTGNTHKRGYRISVDVRRRSQGDGYSTESFRLFGNVSQGEFLEEVHAFNAKKLARFAADPMVLAKLQDLKALVVATYQAKQQTETLATV